MDKLGKVCNVPITSYNYLRYHFCIFLLHWARREVKTSNTAKSSQMSFLFNAAISAAEKVRRRMLGNKVAVLAEL